ncbi:WXG100 family type VII secretion target [uncultured Gemmiger sp.]|uniref:WXG100 family type VII secretion target n=1 Tax=uncultured Gemmiger sp. TaxID=1623490 RepID=UPI0025EDD6C3|nr:WXG100 family type VII secretion target [uncultured Gemmiger sp.]
MKNSAQIYFDFQNALSQAEKLEDLADEIDRKVADQMEESAQQLHSAWTGDSANRYIGKENELWDKVKQSARDLRNIAEEIRRIAKRVHDAEMAALRIAQTFGQ